MKNNFYSYLVATITLWMICQPLVAQNTPSAQQEKVLITTTEASGPSFDFTDVSLSDPAIFGNDPFTISLLVVNTGDKEGKHKVALFLEDISAPGGKRRLQEKHLALPAGKSETVDFIFQVKDLVKENEAIPANFVFYLGDVEISIGYAEE